MLRLPVLQADPAAALLGVLALAQVHDGLGKPLIEKARSNYKDLAFANGATSATSEIAVQGLWTAVLISRFLGDEFAVDKEQWRSHFAASVEQLREPDRFRWSWALDRKHQRDLAGASGITCGVRELRTGGKTAESLLKWMSTKAPSACQGAERTAVVREALERLSNVDEVVRGKSRENISEEIDYSSLLIQVLRALGRPVEVPAGLLEGARSALNSPEIDRMSVSATELLPALTLTQDKGWTPSARARDELHMLTEWRGSIPTAIEEGGLARAFTLLLAHRVRLVSDRTLDVNRPPSPASRDDLFAYMALRKQHAPVERSVAQSALVERGSRQRTDLGLFALSWYIRVLGEHRCSDLRTATVNSRSREAFSGQGDLTSLRVTVLPLLEAMKLCSQRPPEWMVASGAESARSDGSNADAESVDTIIERLAPSCFARSRQPRASGPERDTAAALLLDFHSRNFSRAVQFDAYSLYAATRILTGGICQGWWKGYQPQT